MTSTTSTRQMVVDTLAGFLKVDPATIKDDTPVFGNCADAASRGRLVLALMQANAKRGRMQVIGPASIPNFSVQDLVRQLGEW